MAMNNVTDQNNTSWIVSSVPSAFGDVWVNTISMKTDVNPIIAERIIEIWYAHVIP